MDFHGFSIDFHVEFHGFELRKVSSKGLVSLSNERSRGCSELHAMAHLDEPVPAERSEVVSQKSGISIASTQDPLLVL